MGGSLLLSQLLCFSALPLAAEEAQPSPAAASLLVRVPLTGGLLAGCAS